MTEMQVTEETNVAGVNMVNDSLDFFLLICYIAHGQKTNHTLVKARYRTGKGSQILHLVQRFAS